MTCFITLESRSSALKRHEYFLLMLASHFVALALDRRLPVYYISSAIGEHLWFSEKPL
jgi:hypothetical protein